MIRRTFLRETLIFGGTIGLSGLISCQSLSKTSYARGNISDFSKRLVPMGRILELEDYYVWGCSPIRGPRGNYHAFFSRWKADKGMSGWISQSEIAHAIADVPEGPYSNVKTILAPRGENYWDATTCHNPHIQFIDGKYCLFYMGNKNKRTNTKRIGLALADNLNGPWIRPDQPLLEVGPQGAWDDHCTSNPSFLKHPNGEYWLYYKSWNNEEYENPINPKIRGNRKYGLVISKTLEGPYERYSSNPIIDYSDFGNNRQLEDGNVFIENGTFYMLSRDMGRFDHEVGIILESKDGIHWSEPKISYFGVSHYVDQPPKPKHLSKYGRFERPQVLMNNGKPEYLFVTTQGGIHLTSSPFVFKIKN